MWCQKLTQLRAQEISLMFQTAVLHVSQSSM